MRVAFLEFLYLRKGRPFLVTEEFQRFTNQKCIEALRNPTVESVDKLIAVAQQAYTDFHDLQAALKVTNFLKNNLCLKLNKVKDFDEMLEFSDFCVMRDYNLEEANAFWRAMLFEAQHYQVDSYFLYLERKRDYKDKFYKPRRKKFFDFELTQALQGMIDDKYDILCISMVPGSGKAQPLYSKVLTPEGFVRMGDIKVGQEVIDGEGNIANVIGVYPQGKRPTYQITFDDGSMCKASDNHLWYVKTRDDRKRNKDYRIIKTTDMLSNYRLGGDNRCNYCLPYIPKFDFSHTELPLHPYFVGIMLGDGCMSNLTVTLPDVDIRDRISNMLPQGYSLKYKDKYDYYIRGHEGNNAKAGSKVRKIFNELGIGDKHSYDKFIPKSYLYSSYKNRLELLRGLLDSDGSVGKSNNIIYTTTSEQLSQDVIDLVHSLGGYASHTIKTNCGYRKDGEFIKCRDSHNVNIHFSSNQPNPFWIKRKADRYKPRRKELSRFITNIEYIGEEECQCILIDSPCHLYITDDYIITHNTTAEKFFNSGVIGWYPKDYNLFYSHSSDITRMYYDGVYQIVTDDQEYTWGEVFPDLKVSQTNAKMQQFNIGAYKPFPSLQTASIGSENAGKVRASKFLLLDDLIGKLEEALNNNMLDKIWSAYSVDARQRKTNATDGKFCKEIAIMTRWSVRDPIARITQAYAGNERVKVISVPDIDPETGRSNYEYEIGGFSVQNFHDQQLLMDDISYRCLYKQDPIEREGLLYHEEDLRRYASMPDSEPDAIIGICDTKTTGIDYMYLPIMYQYGEDYYLVDCICDDSTDFNVQYQRITDIVLEHNMQQLEFESNAGGSRIAHEINDRVTKEGGRCNITTHPTETNKETRIIVNSDWVKRHVLFREKENYMPKSDYGQMMNFVLSYSVAGKNSFDDVPDGLAIFAEYVTKRLYRKHPTAVIINSPI